MRKTYRCSNIKFCMEDENQRRTWKYLQGITRKDGSYGKILSDAFVEVLDGQIQTGTDKAVNDSDIPLEQNMDILEKMLVRVLEQKFHEMFQELQRVLTEQISNSFSEYTSSAHFGAEKLLEKADAEGMEQMQETELSEDMMAFAFAMGGSEIFYSVLNSEKEAYGTVPKCLYSAPSPMANDVRQTVFASGKYYPRRAPYF